MQSLDTVPPSVYGGLAATSPLSEVQSGSDDARPPEARTVDPQVTIAPDLGHGSESVESAPRPWRATMVAERPIVPAQRHATARLGMLASFKASCRGLVQSVQSLAHRLLERL